MTREEILQEAERRGYKYQLDYGNCAQCTLLVIQELFNIPDEGTIRAATGFAGGIGRTGSVCGALNGGVLALGLLYGRKLQEMTVPEPDKKLRAKLYPKETEMLSLAKKLSVKFEREFGSTLCDEIERKIFGRSFDKWNPKDREEKDHLQAHEQKCPAVVGKAARWIAELILDEQETR